ncbi:SubName: Full=Uncharacterized protein {ECO:0000313/EMBL:CCA68924.1} [Serendipita indica DSM 11827]|nr:SubName: Full=Uncharacterized protein {ECO:0000313/EMBL:CCA68924.1} [Serendipita indica DSM 11827]
MFPKGTYAPTMGVFGFGQDPRQMAQDIHSIFNPQQHHPLHQQAATTGITRSHAEPRFSAAAHFAAMQRSASPPTSQSSHTTSSSSTTPSTEGESEESEEESTEDAAILCGGPTMSQKFSRAFKNLRKLSTGK